MINCNNEVNTMDDLQFRRSIYADPKSQDEAVMLAKTADPAKQQFATAVKQLDDQKRTTENLIDTLHRTVSASATASVNNHNDRTNQQLVDLQNRIQVRFSEMDDKINRSVAGCGGQGDGLGSSSSSGPPRGSYQLRVPDPQNWNRDVLNDGKADSPNGGSRATCR